MEADEHDAKDETLVQDGVDEGLLVEASSQVEMLAHQKNLCEDEGIDDRESVLLGIQMMLREDEALVDGEQSEDNPKVEEDYKQALELIEGPFFKSALPRNGKDLIRHGGTPSITSRV